MPHRATRVRMSIAFENVPSRSESAEAQFGAPYCGEPWTLLEVVLPADSPVKARTTYGRTTRIDLRGGSRVTMAFDREAKIGDALPPEARVGFRYHNAGDVPRSLFVDVVVDTTVPEERIAPLASTLDSGAEPSKASATTPNPQRFPWLSPSRPPSSPP